MSPHALSGCKDVCGEGRIDVEARDSLLSVLHGHDAMQTTPYRVLCKCGAWMSQQDHLSHRVEAILAAMPHLIAKDPTAFGLVPEYRGQVSHPGANQYAHPEVRWITPWRDL